MLRRGDMLSTNRLSEATLQTIRVAGLERQACTQAMAASCFAGLANATNIANEPKFSALAELWLQRAMLVPSVGVGAKEKQTITPWIEVVRYAWAYLFFTERSPGERAFEGRQTQVRDWYNYAAQQAVTTLFSTHDLNRQAGDRKPILHLNNWTIRVEIPPRLGVLNLPHELLPASSLVFHGLRSTNRRDGFGAELVAVMNEDRYRSSLRSGQEMAGQHLQPLPAWSSMSSPNVTVVFRFDVASLDELLNVRELIITVHDPLVEHDFIVHQQRVPLAGNFTAGYGFWLARSEFSRKSLRGLMGRDQGIQAPHLYLMQPFDPGRRIIVMLHGLASSPEAWVNVANELLADVELLREFQIWQVYYPTNMPIVANHATIRRLLTDALQHFDCREQSSPSHGLVLIGHSMGGIIARLMVSAADEELWPWAASDARIDLDRFGSDRSQFDPYLRFDPFPGVERVIFIATPHRGTAVAGRGFARWVSGLIRLPLTIFESLGDSFQAYAGTGINGLDGLLESIPNSIDQLDESDPFIKIAGELPISDNVSYHSIIAKRYGEGALADSDDGLVPYRSAHLSGAESEKIIISGHSVQETAEAIMEIRRILRDDITKYHEPIADKKGRSEDERSAC